MADGTEAWLALIGATFGGAGLKFIEYWLGRDKRKVDEATQIRNELRTEMTSLRTQLETAQKETDEWRDKYYKVVEQLIEEQRKNVTPAPPKRRRKATPKNEESE